MSRKGFVFSLDAILAVAILVLFLLTFSFMSSRALEDPYTLLVLEKQADDALIVLDKTDRLETMEPAVIEDALNETLLPTLSWSMHMEYYNYTGGLMPLGNFTFGSDYAEVDRMAIAERMFIVFEENSTYGAAEPVKYYGIARLRLWAK